jgi:hypothetical protein
MSEQRATERATATVDQWPDPEPEEVEVMRTISGGSP